jgi:hypothetical protein
MAETTSTTPATSVPSTKAPRENALQSKQLADDIASAERTIQSVLAKPELLLALALVGYNEKELNYGLSLFSIAQKKFSARQQALAIATAAKADRDRCLEAAKAEFTTYRETVQANYTKADRANLGASGVVPTDIEKFRTNARSAYAAGSKEPYLSVLATSGFTQERLGAAIRALDELAATDSTCKNAQRTAKATTDERDDAGVALATWMTKFRKLAHTALKNYPGLQALIQP